MGEVTSKNIDLDFHLKIILPPIVPFRTPEKSEKHWIDKKVSFNLEYRIWPITYCIKNFMKKLTPVVKGTPFI